eukprot:gene29829-36947_t
MDYAWIALTLILLAAFGEEDDEDQVLLRHLDGLEMLREQYFKDNKNTPRGQTASDNGRAMWRKISIDAELHDKTENLNQLGSELSRIVDTRIQKIEAQRRVESEQSPMTNASA